MQLPHLTAPFLAIACLTTSLLHAQSSWPQFRGPGSVGHAASKQPLPAKLIGKQAEPTTSVWRVDMAPGHSSPCIIGKRIFLTAAVDNQLQTLCLDRETGKTLWTRGVAAESLERTHRINSAASPTPTADGKHVVSYFGSFGLICYDHAGKEQWRKEMKVLKNIFGAASSPVLHEGKVILVRDTHEQSTLFVLDAKTGDEVWHVDRTGFPSSWSTPVVWQNGDTTELLVYGAFKLTAYALATGKERWSVPGLADEPATVPIIGDGLVYVTSYNMRTSPEVIGLPKWAEMLKRYDTDKNGTLNRDEAKANDSILSRNDADGEGDHPLSGFFRWLDGDRDGELTEAEWQKIIKWLNSFEHRNALVAIRPGDGKRDAEIAWQHGRGVPECPSPVYHDGLIYMIKNGGIGTCLDAKTGKQHYSGRMKARGPRYSSPVVGDGKIFAASARGQITVWKTGTELEIVAQNHLGERIMATPAVLDGHLYVRTETSLYCF